MQVELKDYRRSLVSKTATVFWSGVSRVNLIQNLYKCYTSISISRCCIDLVVPEVSIHMQRPTNEMTPALNLCLAEPWSSLRIESVLAMLNLNSFSCAPSGYFLNINMFENSVTFSFCSRPGRSLSPKELQYWVTFLLSARRWSAKRKILRYQFRSGKEREVEPFPWLHGKI